MPSSLSVARIFLASPPLAFLVILSAVPIIAAGFFVAGRWVTFYGTVVGISLLVANAVWYGLAGKVIHHQWVAIAFIAVAWSPMSRSHSRRLSSPHETHKPNVSLLLLAWIIGWGLMTSAIPKLLGGWLHPGASAVREEIRTQHLAGDANDLLNGSAQNFDNWIVWELADWFTVFLEFGLLLLVVNPRWFRAALILLMSFHVGVLLTLNISFEPVTAAYVVFFAPLIPTKAAAYLASLRRRPGIVAAFFVTLAISLLTVLTGRRPLLRSFAEALGFSTTASQGLILLVVFLMTSYWAIRGSRASELVGMQPKMR